MDLFQTLNPNYQPSSMDEIYSIHENLTRLLNSRKKLLPHIPEYGLSDFPSLEGKRGLTELIQKEIEQAIRTFEPRILSVEVTHVKNPDIRMSEFVAIYNIKAVLKSDPRGMGLNFKYKIRLDGQIEEAD
ncbi:type VI secretion system baseplate subunit TssE [bacterium]|nr:type VI secretion system baseplate subunit TssE [candidate division CSSED10-310 bacterium]